MELITEVGLDRVRIAEIARRVDMSSGQVMYYFASKEQILLETLAWQEHQDIRRTRAALAKVTGAWRLARAVHRPLSALGRLQTRAGFSGWRHGPGHPTTGR